MDDPVGPFIRRDLKATRIGGGQVLVSLAGGGGGAHRFPEPAAAALLGCRRFDSLAGHAARAQQDLRLDDKMRVPLEQELGRALRLGLLAGWQDLAAVAARAAAPPGPLDTVAILTHNRAEAFSRSLRSHLEHARRFGRTVRASVMDSSTDPDQQAHTREAALALARETGLQVVHASAQDRSRFADRLARASGVRPDLVHFALSDLHGCGGDAGANRNALLLGHTGRIFLSSDDDVVCEPHLSQSSDRGARGLRVTSEKDPTEVRLFDSAAAAESAVPAAATDLLAEHERLIGRTLASLLAERLPETASVDQLAPDLLASLLDGRAQVTVTSSAILGDCGARFPSFYLWRPEVRQQLAALPEGPYRALVESRQIRRAAPAPTVTSGSFLMAGHLTIDHRALLPPFFPVLRGEDVTFGRMLALFSDSNLIGHLPEAIVHAPLEARRSSRQHLWPPDPTPAIPSLLDACIRTAANGCGVAAAGAARLMLIGRHLRELAAQDEPVFDQMVRVCLAEGAGAQLAAWHRELERSPLPPGPWLGDFDSLRAVYLETLQPGRPIAASELVERFGVAEGKRLTRKLVGDFGELLESWPAVSAAATQLERAGQGLFYRAGGG
jgi:hypothetical protein